MRFLHAMVRVTDLDASLAFYRLLGLQEVDLVPYLTTEDPIISVRVNGLPPMQNVDIRADYTLKFAVSAQGACGAGRILKDYKDAEDAEI